MEKKHKTVPSVPKTQKGPGKTSLTKTRKKGEEEKKARGKGEESFPVVGIGASAGGLEALEKFFQNMPPNPRMAFIVVSHLAPTHVSMMPTLLQKHSSLKVVEVEDGMKIAPNHVYVIPPDRDMGIIKGTLHLMKTEVATGPRAPVNYFFRHLAEDGREKAVGIILSGMGSDGTLGIKAIKGELGMVMVQDPVSAKYNGMPNSAIATGLADYVLPPEKMPDQLAEYEKRFVLGVPKALPPEEVSSQALQKVYMLLRSATGHDFSGYKASTIIRRIQRRMTVHQIDDISKYVVFLQQNQQEIKTLFRELLIGVTNFFRDSEAFDVLKTKALPILLQNKPYNQSLRAWVPGCSTGEEAYSLAITLREVMDELNRDINVQIFATDIDDESIEKARMGTYPGDISADVTPERLKKFFEREDDSYRITRRIREMLVFAAQSIIKDPPLTKLDLICCRNLLIYLNADLQKKLLPLFHYSLNPDGILFLGSSESTGGAMDLFLPIDNKWKIYKRKSIQSPFGKVVEFPLTSSLFFPEARMGQIIKTRTHDFTQMVERYLLEHHTPPVVIADHRGDIAYIHGRTGKFLEPAPGAAKTNNILEMARGNLRLQLPALLRSAYTEKQEILRRDVSVRQNGDFIYVSIRVKPMKEPGVKDLVMVLFEESPPPATLKKGKKRGSGYGKPERDFEVLEKELTYTKESLRTTIEELETANEELKSANEEYQSTNEELQSANEELNSSKEELQSLNEELETLNSELQDKNLELTRNYHDMKNILDNTEIPIVFLDGRLRIKRFTSHIGKVLNLRESDVGRPVTDLVTRLASYAGLFKDVKEVLDTLTPKEVETQSEDGEWYLLKIRPYRTADNVIDGAVLTFLNIQELKRAREELASIKKPA
jgi:two-component system CheB/CheR fusion protein